MTATCGAVGSCRQTVAIDSVSVTHKNDARVWREGVPARVILHLCRQARLKA